MRAQNKQKLGFTIVELLIVIVVIGILAAITIVAYRGIQEKARMASAVAYAGQINRSPDKLDATANWNFNDCSGGTATQVTVKTQVPLSGLPVGHPTPRLEPDVRLVLMAILELQPAH